MKPEEIVERLGIAAQNLAEDIGSGEVIPGRGILFEVVPGQKQESRYDPLETRPCCALGHLLSRAFGNPQVMSEGFDDFYTGARASLETVNPECSKAVQSAVLCFVEGEERQYVERQNDSIYLAPGDRQTLIAGALRSFAGLCVSVREKVLPNVDWDDV